VVESQRRKRPDRQEMSLRRLDLRGTGVIVTAIACLVGVGASMALGAAPAGAAALGKIEELDRPPGTTVESIAAGPDGNLWFTETGSTGEIVKLSPGGQVLSEYSTGTTNQPINIVAGSDGNLWFIDGGPSPAIGRITPNGEINEYRAGLGSGAPAGLALGAGGDVWFTEEGTPPAVGRITPGGEIKLFTSGFNAGSEPGAIVEGAEGDMWFTDSGTNAIGRVTPSGSVSELSIPEGFLDPYDIATGPDGNLWFTGSGENGGEEFIDEVVRLTPAGVFSPFITPKSIPNGIAAGPDGNLWFTGVGNEPDLPPVIGLVTTKGAITEFSSGLRSSSNPVAIAPGPDGNVWFADDGTTPAVGRIGLGAPPASQASPAVTGAGQVGSQLLCEGASWSSWDSLQPSTTAFGFDGYRWLLDGRAIAGATAHAYTPTAEQVGHQLSCSVTVTYPLLNVTVSATSAGVTVSAAPASSPAPTPTPSPAPVPTPRVEANVTWTFGWTRHYTIVESLTAHGVPKGGYVEVTCKGGGCPFNHHRSATVASTKHCHGHKCQTKHCHGHKCQTKHAAPQGPNVTLAGLFKGRHLHVGDTLTVDIQKAGWIGKAFLFTTHSGHAPSVQIACLAPGSTRPGKGC
jgi:streptogramin lyase